MGFYPASIREEAPSLGARTRMTSLWLPTPVDKSPASKIIAQPTPITMSNQSGKSFRSFLGIPPSNPTTTDSIYVIIDAQNEYDHGLLAISNVAESRANIAANLQKYRDAGGDVVHVTHSTPHGAPLFTPGTELAEEFEELKPMEGEMVCIPLSSRCSYLVWVHAWGEIPV